MTSFTELAVGGLLRSLSITVWRAADLPTDVHVEAFGAVLRRHRLAAGFTQEALAERAGLSVRAIQNLERGDRHPYADTNARLLKAFDLSGAQRAEFERAGRTPPRVRGRLRSTTHTPPPIASSGPPTNVPAQLTACIGRETELAGLARAIEEARLVTLVGPGGSGKTRLALQLATDVGVRPRALELFGDGVWLVELDAIGEAALVPHALASAVGVHETRGRELSVTIVDALQDRRAMLVIDNCEHVLAGCARLVELVLSRCPNVRVVATSRQALGLPGEVVRVVPPLDLPPADATAADLERYSAVRLFMERARAAAPGVAIGPDEATQVIAVCRQLDGMPLALELAAARLRGLSVRDLAERLDEPLRLLSATTRPRPRQQSLRAAIDWSYELLDAAHQNLLRQLSVFNGGWTLRASEAVCGPSTAYELAHLIDHSLVQVDWRDPISPRYRLLEIVRRYAAERLAAADEARTAQSAHLDYYLAFAEAAEAGLEGAEQVEWLGRLDAEQANLRAALRWAFENEDAERGARLAAALGVYWDIRGERTEGLGWLEAAVLLSARASTGGRVRVLRAAGRLAVATRNHQAEAWLNQSLALAREQGDRAAIVRAQIHLGQLRIDEAALDQAIAVLEEARGVALAIDDCHAIAATLVALGQARLDGLDYAGSLPLLEDSRDRFRALGDRVGQATALLHLAMACLEMNDAAHAQAPLEEAEALLRELGDAVGVAFTQLDLGRLALDLERPAEAAILFGRSLELFRSLGHGTGVAWSHHNLGRALVALGEPDAACVSFETGLHLFRSLEHRRGMGWALYNLAWVVAERGDADQASAYLLEGLAFFREVALAAGLSATLVAAARLVLEREPLQAARWLGMADGLHKVATQDRARADLVAREAHQRLSAEAFQVEWAAGNQISATDLDTELDLMERRLQAVPA